MGGISITQLLAMLTVVMFMAMMVFTRDDKNRLFVQYILLSFPFLAIYLLPGTLAMTTFDLITYLYFFVFYRPKKVALYIGHVYTILFVFLLAVILMGLIFADSLGNDTIRDIIAHFPIFIFAKILTDECVDDPKFFHTVVKCLQITLFVSLIFLACQFVFGIQFNLVRTANPNIAGTVVIRYPSFMSDPQVYSQFLAATSFLCLIKNYDAVKLPYKNYILLILSLVAILYTGGRSGFGGWGLGLFLVIFLGNSNYRISALIACTILFIVIYNFQDSFPIFNRGDDLKDSYDFRYSIWEDAFRIFQKNPFVGIGLGNYSNYVSVHNPDQFWMVDNEFVYFDHPESGYLKFLTELGALGFLAIFAFILIPIFNGLRLYFITKDISIVLLIAGVVSWMVGFYTVYSFGDVRIKILITTLTCLLATSYARLEEPEPEEDETV